MAWAWQGKCESGTAALCKSNGKDTFWTLSDTAWQGNSMSAAWERHAMCESALEATASVVVSHCSLLNTLRCTTDIFQVKVAVTMKTYMLFYFIIWRAEALRIYQAPINTSQRAQRACFRWTNRDSDVHYEFNTHRNKTPTLIFLFHCSCFLCFCTSHSTEMRITRDFIKCRTLAAKFKYL